MAAFQRMTTMATSFSLFSRGYMRFHAKLSPSTSSSTPSFKVFFSSAAPRRRRASSRELTSLSKLEKSNAFCTSAVGTVASDVEEETKSKDLSAGGGKVVLPTNDSSEMLLRIRHTCAHVMAMAVQKIFPDAKVTIGPWIENGFYYDFDMEPLTDRDLKRIKKEMDRIISQNLPLIREEVSSPKRI